MSALLISPNPVSVSRATDSAIIKGTVTMKNSGSRAIVFKLAFDSDDFCAISPACGELIPGAEQQLSLLIENTGNVRDVLEYSVRFVSAELGASQEDIQRLMMMNDHEWREQVVGRIHFSSHAEDAMLKWKASLKPRRKVDVDEVIERAPSMDIGEEQIKALEKSIAEKEQTEKGLRAQLHERMETLKKETALLATLRAQPDVRLGLATIALIMLLVAVLWRALFKK